MPSNREWLNDLAANNPQKLNTWFEAEHVDEIGSERKCPGYDPKNNYCRYHAQNFELNDATVSRLKRENHELAKERDEWKASAKACDSCSGNFYYDCVKLAVFVAFCFQFSALLGLAFKLLLELVLTFAHELFERFDCLAACGD